MKIDCTWKVFEDNTIWGKFIQSSKQFQDGRTLEKGQKNDIFYPWRLSNTHRRMAKAPFHFWNPHGSASCTLAQVLMCPTLFCGQIALLTCFPSWIGGQSQPSFHILTLEIKMPNRDPCALLYSFRKLVVQGKSQAFGASWQRFSLLLFSRVCFSFRL